MLEFIGQQIKSLRKHKNLTQRELSEYLEINRNTIATYEAGNSIPSVEVIIRYADFFEVSTDVVLGRNFDLTKSTYK